jgi:hypothetical protein
VGNNKRYVSGKQQGTKLLPLWRAHQLLVCAAWCHGRGVTEIGEVKAHTHGRIWASGSLAGDANPTTHVFHTKHAYVVK